MLNTEVANQQDLVTLLTILSDDDAPNDPQLADLRKELKALTSRAKQLVSIAICYWHNVHVQQLLTLIFTG